MQMEGNGKRRIRMKETIILLYFLQADYGRRLLRFLTRKKNKQIRLELMTERERVSGLLF